MSEQLDLINKVRDGVWEKLTKLANGEEGRHTARTIRSKCVYSAYIQAGFIRRSEFRVLLKQTFQLGNEHVVANVQTLADGPEPSEAVPWRVWHMARAKMNLQPAYDALKMLHQSRGTNELDEEQHGAVTWFHRKHVGFGDGSLKAVSLVNRVSRLGLMVGYIIGCPLSL